MSPMSATEHAAEPTAPPAAATEASTTTSTAEPELAPTPPLYDTAVYAQGPTWAT